MNIRHNIIAKNRIYIIFVFCTKKSKGQKLVIMVQAILFIKITNWQAR